MSWLQASIGRAVELSKSPPGRLLLTRNEMDNKVALLISLAPAQIGGAEHHLVLAEQPTLNGLKTKSSFHESGWDITDVVQLEPVLTEFAIDADGPRHGVIGIDEKGVRVIGCATSGGGRGWFSLEDWKHTIPDGIYQVCLPSWRLVAPNDRGGSTVLFTWPLKTSGTATGGTAFRS